MTTISFVHSIWAILLLLCMVSCIINSLVGRLKNKSFTDIDFRLALFVLITSHIQLIIGFINYFTSAYFSFWKLGIKEVMGDTTARLLLVEHPLINIISIALITIGWSKHKKTSVSHKKFNRILIFYSLGLLLILSRIPWNIWLS